MQILKKKIIRKKNCFLNRHLAISFSSSEAFESFCFKQVASGKILSVTFSPFEYFISSCSHQILLACITYMRCLRSELVRGSNWEVRMSWLCKIRALEQGFPSPIGCTGKLYEWKSLSCLALRSTRRHYCLKTVI